MEIKDLTGLSGPLKKLITVVSAGVGALSKPYLIRKTAEAKAYEIETIAQAIKDNQHNLNNIDLDGEKLSLMSLDDTSIQNEVSLTERTQQRIEYREQKRQKNIEDITQKAAIELESETTVSDEPVEEDWATRFFDYAEDISNENLQGLWAKILAGEIKKPKSYSLRTLDILRNLSTEEAEVFIKFGSLAVRSSSSVFMLNFNEEKLLQEDYGLNFNDRLLLEELGLLAANDLQFKISKTEGSQRQTVFEIGSIVIVQEKQENKPEQQLKVLVFTKIGEELLQFINIRPQMEYLQLLATKLNRELGPVKYANILEKIPNGQVKHTGLIDIPLTNVEEEQASDDKT